MAKASRRLQATRGVARQGTARHRRSPRRRARRFGWARRLGVALAMLIVGATVVLAGQAALNDSGIGGRPSATMPSPSPTPGLPPPPTLLQPVAVTRAPAIDVQVGLPSVTPVARHRLLLYVNDQLVVDRRLPRSDSYTARDVPLDAGENVISATIRGPGGESLPSTAVHVTRDLIPPLIIVSSPTGNLPVIEPALTLRGTTEPDATLSVVNNTTGQSLTMTTTDGGAFELSVQLAMGTNELLLEATDVAGNRASTNLAVVHSESRAAVSLSVSPMAIDRSRLPVRIDLVADVTDELGQRPDGAAVTFSLSPPGQPTVTYQATTIAGRAAWRSYRLPAEGTSKGFGRASVVVELASGDTLQKTAPFSLR
jgi:hypothetical protein